MTKSQADKAYSLAFQAGKAGERYPTILVGHPLAPFLRREYDAGRAAARR